MPLSIHPPLPRHSPSASLRFAPTRARECRGRTCMYARIRAYVDARTCTLRVRYGAAVPGGSNRYTRRCGTSPDRHFISRRSLSPPRPGRTLDRGNISQGGGGGGGSEEPARPCLRQPRSLSAPQPYPPSPSRLFPAFPVFPVRTATKIRRSDREDEEGEFFDGRKKFSNSGRRFSLRRGNLSRLIIPRERGNEANCQRPRDSFDVSIFNSTSMNRSATYGDKRRS